MSGNGGVPDSAQDDAGVEILASDGSVPTEVSGRTTSSDTRSAVPGFFRSRTTLTVAGISLAVVSLVGVYAASTSSAADQYRLAPATLGAVTQTLATSGLLTPASEANVTFPTSGTVAKVSVKEGQKVKAGQQLAKLNTQQLNAAIASAQKSLADAQLNLEQTEAGSTTVSNADTGVQTRAGGESSANQSQSGGSAQSQQTIQKTQKELNSALKAAAQSLQNSSELCSNQPRGDSAPTGKPSSSPSASQPAASDCTSAQQQVLADQLRVSELQRQQTSQLEKLASTSQTSNAAASSPEPTKTTTAPTSEELAAAQAQVDAAAAELVESQQNLRAATIVSPIAGTVLSVPFSKGDTATTGQPIVISGSSQFQATTQISVDKIQTVSIGQSVRIVPSGSTSVLEGTVTAIAVAPTSTDTATTYGVTTSILGNHKDLRSGATADIEIITAQTEEALTVPTSAVHSLGTRQTVTVLEDGQPTPVTVTVGAVGDVETQIESGLEVGDQVVLANLDEAIPSGTESGFRSPAAGGFPGAGAGRTR